MKRPKRRVYDRELSRHTEWLTGFLALNTAPERPGVKSNLVDDIDDIGTYYEGVLVALNQMQTPGVDISTDTWADAMESGDMKALKIFMRAADDVARAKDGITNKAKHVTSLIAAKLELEDTLGGLPTKAAVRNRACKLYKFKFDAEPYASDDSKSWNEAFTAAGLDYLEKR